MAWRCANATSSSRAVTKNGSAPRHSAGDGLGRDAGQAAAGGDDHIDRQAHEFGGQGRQALVIARRHAIFDPDALILDKAYLRQAGAKFIQ